MSESNIEWTGLTWNPIVGCQKVSPGCANCYAERMSTRLAGMARKRGNSAGRLKSYLHVINNHGRWSGEVRTVPEALDEPKSWKKPQLVFVNSMSDLFHHDVPLSFIHSVFRVMADCPRHRFQLLTKRHNRLVQLSDSIDWPGNVWMGVSIESDAYVGRADCLRRTKAAIKFLSLEPLLGPLPSLRLDGIDWVIIGGESGPGARPVDRDWVVDLRDRCQAQGIPFFFKQWGKLRFNPDPHDPSAKENGGSAKGGRMLDGEYWNQMPESTALLSHVNRSI